LKGLYKQESGLPGIVGNAVQAGKEVNKTKKTKKQKVNPDESDDSNASYRPGKHVDQFGEKVIYKSLLQKRNKREDEDDDVPL